MHIRPQTAYVFGHMKGQRFVLCKIKCSGYILKVMQVAQTLLKKTSQTL